MSEAVLNATIAGRHDLNERYALLRVRPDEGPVPPFTPGQFVQLGLPRPAREGEDDGRPRLSKRSYSIASSAEDRDGYELFVTLVEEGRLTPELWKLEPGGRCWVGPRALGSFTLDPVPPGKDLVLVATGTGVAPFVSMLRTYARAPRWRRIALIHGVRSASDFGFRDELTERELADPAFRYLPVASREPEGWRGIRGRVQPLFDSGRFEPLVGWPLDPEACHVFLCGNPAMIESVRELLLPLGFRAGTQDAAGNLHFERYW